MFSKACEYGIRAVLYIAQQSMEGRKANIKEIAKAIDSPEAYTAKILQQLKRDEVIESMKGPTGGFSISVVQINKPLSSVINAIDGEKSYNKCTLGLSECSSKNPCPLHYKFKDIQKELRKTLRSTSINTLAIELVEGRAVLSKPSTITEAIFKNNGETNDEK